MLDLGAREIAEYNAGAYKNAEFVYEAFAS
jgi:hypothetical protein